ncbi:YaaL family protein [Neobacillus mesonae]|nr:YaaL family protein [Neobacillus mesonae]
MVAGWLKTLGVKDNKMSMQEKQLGSEILDDIRVAHEEWLHAHLMFEEAVDQDQIDYAIFTLEAAERKYQMHLKRAKRIGLNGGGTYGVQEIAPLKLTKEAGGV